MLPFRISLIVAAGLIAAACGQSAVMGRVGQSTYQQEVAAESLALARTTDTVYRRRLTDLIRRSRLVPTDPLARLYARIPGTPDSSLHVLRQEIGCEGQRLLVAHGQAAQVRAFRRMADSLEHAGFDYRAQAERMLAAPGPPLHFGGGNCGMRYPRERLPDSLNYEVYPTKYMQPYQPSRPDTGIRRP